MKENYNVSDLIADFISEIQTKHAFVLPGGGNMFMIDSLKRHKNIEAIPCHHEQTASISAEAYSRISQKVGVAFVTSGPGSTNAITGTVGAWIESTPLIIFSGQTKKSDLMKNNNQRQNGVQEVNIIGMVNKITKFCFTIKNKNNVIKILNKAYRIAISKRPGPVWIDVPLDIQAAIIKKPKKIIYTEKTKNKKINSSKISKFIKMLEKAKRPVFLIGHGTRIANAEKYFLNSISKFKIPVLFTWNSLDLLNFNHRLNFGRPGNVALRSSNFIIQNSDLLVCVGCKLDNIVTAFNPKNFAPRAKKIFVNIDKITCKNLKVPIDLFFQNDAKDFFEKISKITLKKKYNDWIRFCQKLKDKYKIENEKKFKNKGVISHHQAVNELSKYIPKDKIITTGSSGLAIEQFYTFFKNKSGQRIFLTSGLGAMGYGIPASIGASFASNKKPLYLIEGDGSFQMNIQDLAVISAFKLPITIIIFNNDGYASIRNTQRNYFKGRYCGTGPEANLKFPNLKLISKAYGLNYITIKKINDFKKLKKNLIYINLPKIIDIKVNRNETLSPKVSAIMKPNHPIISMPLEDMSPLLDIEELKSNMLSKLSANSLRARN